jgi:hypothetical protein
MTTFLKVVGALVLIALLFLGVATLSAWFVMLLVNYLFTSAVLTAMFGVAKLTLWRAWCLTVLSGILFKSITYNSSK